MIIALCVYILYDFVYIFIKLLCDNVINLLYLTIFFIGQSVNTI